MRKCIFLLAATSLAIAWCRSGSLLQQAPASYAARANPFDGDNNARRAGAKLYGRECAACHGARREGIGKAPPLNAAGGAIPAGNYFWVLRNGSLAHGMPSFAHLPEAQRWQIVTYLQSQ